MKDLQSSLDRPALLSPLNFIDGEWQSALSGETFAVHNPATGEVIANVPDSQRRGRARRHRRREPRIPRLARKAAQGARRDSAQAGTR